ncbi:MAG: FHA domain-containing protein [Rudaea sp.]|nr:FHA domain-containing protein [Rudaea sp.]
MEAVTMPRGVLEVLDRNGRVEQRVAVNGPQLRIGRACDNDLILDDVHVSPHHAAIDASSGHWALRDLHSVNGIRVAAAQQRVSELALDGEQSFTLGLSQLRYRPLDVTVPEALPLRERRHPHRGLALTLVAPLACLAGFGVDALLDSYEPFGTLKLLNAILIPLVAILIWAGIWALIGRLLVQRLHFAGHLAVISLGLLFATTFDSMSRLGAFAFALDRALPWLQAGGLCATFVLILYGHLRLASRVRQRNAFAAAVAFGMLLAGAMQIKQLVYLQRFSPRPQFTLTLAPPGARLVRADSTEAFYARTARLTDALANDASTTAHGNTP